MGLYEKVDGQWVKTSGGSSGGSGSSASVTAENIKTALGYTPADQAAVDELSAQIDAAIVPSYWVSAVDTAAKAVKTRQNLGGNQVVSFAHFSDMHVFDSDNNYCRNIGVIAAAVMDACNIPLAVNNGDVMTNDSINEDYVSYYIPNCYARAWEYMGPIGKEKILCNAGNHDGAYGYYNTDEGVAAYRFNLPPETLWQYIHRPGAQDFRRVFGENGKYFYIDNIPQKTRFVMLNSHDGVYSENEDGTAVWSTMKGCYQQAQLDWLANKALSVDEGWSIVLFSHVPPTAKLPTNYSGIGGYSVVRGIVAAYANKETFSGSYSYNADNGEGEWANSSVSVDYTEANGEIVAWFCGHAHRDAIVTGDLPFPIITVTCAGNFSYNAANEGTRTLESATETALDLVSIDKASKMIYMTRLGIGTDREISYADTPDTDVPDVTLAPFAYDESLWTANTSGANLQVNENSISWTKLAQSGDVITHLYDFERKAGTYSFSVMGDGVVENNRINTIVQIFDADGNEITETGHYVPNHGYSYNSAWGGFAMNTGYGSFEFSLSESVATFRMKFSGSSVYATGDTITASGFTLTEPS